NYHIATVGLTGLTANQKYCAEVVATAGTAVDRGGKAAFTAGLPDAATSDAVLTSATTADIEGSVTPAGQNTTYLVDYGVAGSPFCTSGTLPAPNSATAQGPISGTSSQGVSASLTGLTGNTDYCAEIVATNATASKRGGRITFKAGEPDASTGAATS